jgi:hypothetical protein
MNLPKIPKLIQSSQSSRKPRANQKHARAANIPKGVDVSLMQREAVASNAEKKTMANQNNIILPLLMVMPTPAARTILLYILDSVCCHCGVMEWRNKFNKTQKVSAARLSRLPRRLPRPVCDVCAMYKYLSNVYYIA